MRHFYLILLSILVLYSCRGPEKLIEKEKYDLIIKRVKNVLKRKKPPSVEWVKSTERAFELANQKDRHLIEVYQKKDKLSYWKKVYYLLRKIDLRQDKIHQYTPLTDETGYTASFIFQDTELEKQAAQSQVASIYFAAATEEIEKVRAGSKKAALASIRLLDSTLVWKNDLYQAKELRQEAIDSAIVRVALYVNSTSQYSDIATDIENYLYRDFNRYFKLYLQVKVNPDETFKSDYYFFVEPISIDIGYEQMSRRETCYSKEVVTGHKTVKEWNASDSTWISKTIEIKETVHGKLIEIEQNKDASMQAIFSLEDSRTRKVYYQKPINTSYRFCNKYSKKEGDRRALSSVCSFGSHSSFPSDSRMENRMSQSMAYQACAFIKKRDWWAE